MSELIPEYLNRITEERENAILKRSMEDISTIYSDMRKIVMDVKQGGDAVVLSHYEKYKADIVVDDLVVSRSEIEAAYDTVDANITDALRLAAANIEKFHKAQLEREMWSVEISEGIMAGRLIRPLDCAGAYVPGGLASYPSSVLMNIIPAKVAGVRKVVTCTPPGKGMMVNPATLAAAHIAGVDHIFKIGGPWAIAAMAYGTSTVPKVDKIVGPGNKYVTCAKMVVFGEVDIDSPAGPSEVLIIADETADPRLMAIDFLSQVEHDQDASAVLVTTSETLANKVSEIMAKEVPHLPRREIIEAALGRYSAILIAESLDEAIDFSNSYAPEHLQIVTSEPYAVLPRIKHAGSIFLGAYAPVPAGDYASGTNHVLPTGRCARMFSGLSVDDFVKKPTFQYISEKGLRTLKDTVITLAEAEGLPVHAMTIKERFPE
jgi:histidinol dehydrogenase